MLTPDTKDSDALFRDITPEFEECQSDNVTVSSEVFFDGQMVEELANRLADRPIKVISHLRRQDESASAVCLHQSKSTDQDADLAV